ncbi:hypothetical protein BGZ83_009352 [Gryganskiella cystojenkinii]|nr:hypothetical protein BGZ83_009352 [Gryganskiella cystojenkinii]
MVRLTDPMTQIVVLGFVIFCCPGMFNAVTSIGSMGLPPSEAEVANNSDTALNSLFAVSSLLAGGIFNLIGHRWLLFFGCLTYTLYIASYFAYGHIQSVAFTVIAACALGIGAGLLWCAQGAIIMGYPLEGDKGKAFGIFWAIFNLGPVLGDYIPMGAQWNDKGGLNKVSDPVYITFMCLTALGAFLSFLILPSDRITRADGSSVVKVKFSSASVEVRSILGLFKDWRMLCLFPMFFTSNFFYGYQFNSNGKNNMNVRTRSFNASGYWGAQIVASLAFGYFLDRPSWTRTTRARYSFLALIALLIATWGGALAFQSTIGPVKGFKEYDMVNTTSEWIKFFLLYVMFGVSDAMFQGFSYWLMGSLSNDIQKVARYAGFYKCAQNIGGIFKGQLANTKISNTWAGPVAESVTDGMGEVYVNIALIVVSLILAAPVVLKAVTETTVEESTTQEDIKQEYADETKV